MQVVHEIRGTDALAMRVANALLAAGTLTLQSVDRRLRDPISQLAVESIIMMGPRNLSEVADYVRERKGSSSRTTLRQRMRKLIEDGIVEKEDRTFHLTEKFIAQWWSCFNSLRGNLNSMGVETSGLPPATQRTEERFPVQ
jgi:hypothetical protein